MSEEQTNDLSIEESFAELDRMVERLESEDLPLEESFRIYESGMRLLKSASEKVDQVEQKIRLINEEGEVSEFS